MTHITSNAEVNGETKSQYHVEILLRDIPVNLWGPLAEEFEIQAGRKERGHPYLWFKDRLRPGFIEDLKRAGLEIIDLGRAIALPLPLKIIDSGYDDFAHA